MMRQQRDPVTAKRAKQLRRDMTPPERALWNILRGHRLDGWKFTRQVPVGPYILDFAARRERLAVELDGDSHVFQEEHDRRRTGFLEEMGWRVIRFPNSEADSNPEGVALMILAALQVDSPSPQPWPEARDPGHSRWGEGV